MADLIRCISPSFNLFSTTSFNTLSKDTFFQVDDVHGLTMTMGIHRWDTHVKVCQDTASSTLLVNELRF